MTGVRSAWQGHVSRWRGDLRVNCRWQQQSGRGERQGDEADPVMGKHGCQRSSLAVEGGPCEAGEVPMKRRPTSTWRISKAAAERGQ